MPMTLSSLSLKRYLFLLIAIFVVLLAGAQIGFIHYIQQQIGQEVQEKSRTLSNRALDMLVENLPENAKENYQVAPIELHQQAPISGIVIKVENTPNKTIELGEGYQFVTGEDTQTVTIDHVENTNIHQVRKALREGLHKLNISRVDSSYAYTVGFDQADIAHQQIVQFNPQDSALQDYFQWLTLGTLAVCLTGLLLAYWLARHISNPLGELSKGFNRLEKGDLGTQVNAEGIQDVKDTLDKFNHMSERLAQLKQLEHQFQQQQQLAELGEVTRGLAHTLRNPINTIGLSLEHMADAQLTQQQREELAMQARQKITHLDNTIKALLQLTAKGIDRQQTVSVNAVIEDIIMELSMSGKHAIAFSPVQQVKVTGAESEIRAMLHTLLTNAVEASQESQPISVFVNKQNDSVSVTVVDEGPGLSDSIREKLFQPHVSSKPEGAGMGLYIAKRLSQSYYAGDITLEDNSPTGCVATMRIAVRQGGANV